MRACVIAATAVLTLPAWAQEVDGKAAPTGRTAELLAEKGATAVATREEMRALMTAFLDDRKISDDEKDLLAELVGGAPVSVTVAGREVDLPAVPDDLRRWPQLLLTPPNLHQLWGTHAPGAENMVEMSRWGPAMHQRIVMFIGNRLDDAWAKSNVLNGYGPFVQDIAVEWKSLETLPADVEMRAHAYELFTSGIAHGLQKASSAGREPPKEFLYAWLAGEDVKTRFINGKPPA